MEPVTHVSRTRRYAPDEPLPPPKKFWQHHDAKEVAKALDSLNDKLARYAEHKDEIFAHPAIQALHYETRQFLSNSIEDGIKHQADRACRITNKYPELREVARRIFYAHGFGLNYDYAAVHNRLHPAAKRIEGRERAKARASASAV